MARKEIQGFNVPFEGDDKSGNRQSRDNNRRGLLNVPGVGASLSQSESKDKRRGLLNVPGIGVPLSPSEAELEKTQQRAQKKVDRKVKKAQKKENKQTFKQEKTAATGKIRTGLFAAILGAATGNPAVTAGGAGVAVDGMVDTLKARQNNRARKKNPNYNANSQSRKSNESTVKEVFNLVKPIFDKEKTKSQSTAEAPSESAKKANSKSHKPNYEDDIIDGEFIVFEDIVDGEFTVVEDGKS